MCMCPFTTGALRAGRDGARRVSGPRAAGGHRRQHPLHHRRRPRPQPAAGAPSRRAPFPPPPPLSSLHVCYRERHLEGGAELGWGRSFLRLNACALRLESERARAPVSARAWATSSASCGRGASSAPGSPCPTPSSPPPATPAPTSRQSRGGEGGREAREGSWRMEGKGVEGLKPPARKARGGLGRMNEPPLSSPGGSMGAMGTRAQRIDGAPATRLSGSLVSRERARGRVGGGVLRPAGGFDRRFAARSRR